MHVVVHVEEPLQICGLRAICCTLSGLLQSKPKTCLTLPHTCFIHQGYTPPYRLCRTAHTWSCPCHGCFAGDRCQGKSTCHNHARERTGGPDLDQVSILSETFVEVRAVLTAVNVLAVAVLARQTARFIAQSIQLCSAKLRLVLKIAEFAVLAMAAEVPVITHLLASAHHTVLERLRGIIVTRW